MTRMFLDNLAWAAGLFEGEGCITLSGEREGYPHLRYPRLSLTMVDEDIVRQFHAAVGGLGAVRGPYGPYQANRQPSWQWMAAKQEHTQAVVALLWSRLGVRRQARAREVFAR